MKLNRLIPALPYGLGLIACGCLFSILFGEAITLTCTRVESTQIRCERRAVWLGLVPRDTEIVRAPYAARVEESCDQDGCTYRVTLDTETGPAPLTGFYTSGLPARQETADRLNTFLQDHTQKTVTVQANTGLSGALLPLVLMAIGLLILAGGFARAVFWRA